MDYQIGLAMGVAALGFWTSVRFSVIGFSLFSFVVAFGCLLLSGVMGTDGIGLWRSFAIWMLFNVCYVVGGVFLPCSIFRREAGKSKAASTQVYPHN